tara:strand:- start:569 stop:1393 length:825 start_codon:yes stop_codon:yes gene_type:complete
MVYNDDKYPTQRGSRYELDNRLSRMALGDENNTRNSVRMKKAGALFDYTSGRKQELEEWQESVQKWRTQRRKKMQNRMWMMLGNIALNSMMGQGPGMGGYTTGPGTVGSKLGNWWSGLGRGGGGVPGGGGGAGGMGGGKPGFGSKGLYAKDDIPAMLMGGEYVINADAVKRHGVKYFHDLNAGRIKGYADGGLVEDGSNSVNSAGSSANSGDVNNITINVNVDQGGGVSATATGGTNKENAAQLAKDIKRSVISTIVQQKRLGGILYQGNISGT